MTQRLLLRSSWKELNEGVIDDSWWFKHITLWSSRVPILLQSMRGASGWDLGLAEFSVNLMNYDARLLLRPSSRDFVEGILTTSNYKFDQYIYIYIYCVAASLTAFDVWCFRLGPGHWPNSSFDVCIAMQGFFAPRAIVDLWYLRVNEEDLV